MTRPGSVPRRSVPSPPASVALATLALVTAVMAGAPTPLAAQAGDPPRGPVTAGVALNISQPRGAFDEDTGLGWGLSGNALFRLDENAIFNVRTELSFLNNGNTRRRVPLSPTLGNLIQVDLRTSSNIASFVVGPQLLGPTGAFTPYAAALGGFSAFWTTSSVEGSNQTEPFASTTNSSDFAWTYGGAAGAYIRVQDGPRPVRMELGLRYLRHDDVRYLSTNEVRNAYNQGRDPVARRSRVDFYTYMIGVHAIVF
jgi:hypothetical protein